MRRSRPVVVTDMHEPLIVVHRRMMRTRLVLLGIWLVGWVVSGLLYRTGWLATLILLASGPGVWLVVVIVTERRRPGRREAVSPRRRALEPGAPGEGADR